MRQRTRRAQKRAAKAAAKRAGMLRDGGDSPYAKKLKRKALRADAMPDPRWMWWTRPGQVKAQSAVASGVQRRAS